MTPYRHPGLLGDEKEVPFWPLLLVSALLHVGLFWGFRSLNFGGSKRILATPVTMVELAGPGLGEPAKMPAQTASSEAPAGNDTRPPAPPERPERKPAKPAKPIPKAEPPRAKAPPKHEPPRAASRPRPAPPPPPKQERPPKAEAVKVPSKSPPPAPTRPVATPPPPPPPPREAESPEEHVADRIAKLREKRAALPEDLVADRIAKIREKRSDSAGETDVADRIAKIRERQIQGSETQVAHRIETLREKYGTREPTKGSGRPEAPGGSPLAVQGSAGQGALGLIEANYLRSVKDRIDVHWSVPEPLKGKGYRAAVTVFVNRNGVITDWALQGSGNAFFDERVKRAVTEANPLPSVPAGLPGQRFEYELRFSAP